ncbi:MAG TPA: transketolase C-terminal domain-containing protein [bacterium]|nr:transketolase C-terminal domain-containing protein [bacterium]
MAEKMRATRDGAGDGMLELAKAMPEVVALTGDMAGSTRTDKFEKLFPDRFFNMGIAEQDLIGTAAGLALAGKVPYACSFSSFILCRALDQIRVSVCYNNANVKIVGTHSGITVGPDGATAQMLEDIALMRVLPNMCVLVPSDAEEARKAVVAAASWKGPVFIRVGRNPAPAVTAVPDTFGIGKANLLARGNDVTIVACGIMVRDALDAAAELAQKGVGADVINMHTIAPLDAATLLASVEKTGAAVTAEEHQLAGGLGGAVAECLAANFPVPVEMIGIAGVFGESGESDELKLKYGLTKEKIVEACLRSIGRKGRA